MNKLFCDILIKNTSYLNENLAVTEDINIIIKDKYIFEITKDSSNYNPESIIDGKNLLWMPGLTDSHMHTCQQLLKGKILDELPMIWTRIMLPFESTLTRSKVNLSTSLSSLEMIKCGTTSFIDAGGIFMDDAAEVYIKSGLRGALSCSTMDNQNLPQSIRTTTQEALKNLNSLYNNFHNTGDKRLQVFYSLRSLISCSEELIKNVFSDAKEKNIPVEAHMNEYPNEINFFLEKYQCRPLEFLNKENLLNDKFISAHSIFLSDNEIDILKENNSSVVHCPFSNCGKGIPNTPSLLQKGINVSLGSDGAAHGGMSIFQEMKVFRSIMNLHYGVKNCNPSIMPAKALLKMATENGGITMQHNNLGILKPNNLADLIAIDLNQPHLSPTNNIVNTIVESVNGNDVIHTIINGKIIMKNREVLTLDEEKILYEAKKYFIDNK